MEFDEAVDRFGPAVAGPAGVEVGQERFAPSLEGLTEPFDLGDRAGRERREDLFGDLLALVEVVSLVGRPELLGAVPRDLDLDVSLVGCEGLVESAFCLSVSRSAPQRSTFWIP